MQSSGKPISEKIGKEIRRWGLRFALVPSSSRSTQRLSYGDAQTQRFPLDERAIQAVPAPSHYLKHHWKNF
ncbi:hypothetical protein KFK09_010680 [Dendrobium nobile]|uniref:Uncharacterized protein n=1 Tax=Dendrobium nobile TaxID=94219 RepID=A0A8T3BCS7_DENNO|nr:hypothetical protein KFK09_010680 [Dendrobium nobile]